MKKRGDFLVKHLLGIVIALVGISLLIFAVAKLYEARVENDTLNAKRTLDLIIAKINALGEGKSEITLQGFKSSSQWYIVSWAKSGAEIGPDKCYPESCLCMCPDGADAESCQNKGVCVKIKGKEISVSTLPFNHSVSTLTSLPIGIVVHGACIPLSRQLMLLEISGKDSLFEIVHSLPVSTEFSVKESIYKKCIRLN